MMCVEADILRGSSIGQIESFYTVPRQIAVPG